jgi:hypothetical protein
MRDEIVRDMFVARVDMGAITWEEGDHFALRDIDGGEPTGDYVIAAIRLQYVSRGGSGPGAVPFRRVWFCVRDGGHWVREVNCVRKDV